MTFKPSDTEYLSRYRRVLLLAPALHAAGCSAHVQGGNRTPTLVSAAHTVHHVLAKPSSALLSLCLHLASLLAIVLCGCNFSLLPTYSSVFSLQIAYFLISKLLYPQCSLTLLVSLVTGIFQREANRTVMSCAVLPMRDDLS